MNRRSRVAAAAAMGLLLVFLLLISVGNVQKTRAQAPPKAMGQGVRTPSVKTAAEVYKNIQVLKNIPAYELIPTMEFISASLGVHCDFCHVEHHFDRDTKRTKRRARQMMRMMFAIDRANFHGRQVVTCNTCHNGSTHPMGMPEVAGAQNVMPHPAHFREHGRHFNLASLPQPDMIVARYVEALGGANALRKISSRVTTATMTAFGHTLSLEIYAKAPDERASVMKFARGGGLTVYNGHAGWARMGPRPLHPMEGSELDQARLEADFYFPLDIHQNFTSLRERRPQKVGGQEAYLLMGMRPGKPPVELFFSKQSGLLVRTVYFAQTALGRLPQQIDYADYRAVNGVKVPFQWTVSRPGEQSTVQVAQVQQNVPISPSKFAIPTGHGPAMH